MHRLARGEPVRYRFVRLGATPAILQGMGLGPADLVMSAAKIVRAMREHAQVGLDVWERLPALIGSAIAGFPSQRGDGSIIVVIVERDAADDPIVVPILWDAHQKLNIVLSVYGRAGNGRQSGDDWIKTQLARAALEDAPRFVTKGFADAKPKPEPAPSKSATSWSPGSIPADRPAKPDRDILRLPPTINEPDDA